LPCGSMSQQSTRWPSSAKATARLSVVVVLATPPFWLANAITLAVAVTGHPSEGSGLRWVGQAYAPVFAARWRNPPDRQCLPSFRAWEIAHGTAGMKDG